MKKKLYIIISTCLSIMLSLTLISAATSTYYKTSTGTFYFNTMKYSLTAAASLSYNSSGAVTSASSLAFTSKACNTIQFGGPACIIIPTQKSKRISGNNAIYVVSLKRTAAGVYTDTVDLTMTYTVSRSYSQYSMLKSDGGYDIDVSIETSEPYDIVYSNE